MPFPTCLSRRTPAPGNRALRRAAQNYVNARTDDAIEAALKRIARIGATVEYHRPTDEVGVGSHKMGWVSVPYWAMD